MDHKKELQKFYKEFLSFETYDGSFNWSPENTTFDLKKWIDQLRDKLMINHMEMPETIIKQAENTPYLEFEFAWKYIRRELMTNWLHFTWSDGISPVETDFYALQNLSTFIYSLLNRMTMVHYILDNEDYLDNFKTSNGKDDEELLAFKFKDKLKRVTFNNWRYNPLIREYENSILWKHYLIDARNANEHYGVLFKVGNLKDFNLASFSFYPEIIIVTFFFLLYLDKYVTEFKNR